MMKRLLTALLAALVLLSCVAAMAEGDNAQSLYEGTAETVNTGAVENGEGLYRVYVYDQEGAPVEGAFIQFCDDATCAFQPTDADGLAEFNVEETKVYEIHVLKVPDGYQMDETIYETLDTFSDLSICLEKE